MFLGPATLVVAFIVLAVAAAGIAILLGGARAQASRATCPTPGCGRRNRPGADFCASCGRKLK